VSLLLVMASVDRPKKAANRLQAAGVEPLMSMPNSQIGLLCEGCLVLLASSNIPSTKSDTRGRMTRSPWCIKGLTLDLRKSHTRRCLVEPSGLTLVMRASVLSIMSVVFKYLWNSSFVLQQGVQVVISSSRRDNSTTLLLGSRYH
jgi:hypothetical protein